MNKVTTFLSFVLISSTVFSADIQLDECGKPVLSSNSKIVAEWEYFKNADNQTAQKLFIDYKERVSMLIVTMEDIISSIKTSKDRAFVCYAAAEVAEISSNMGHELSLIFLLNRPGKSCFKETPEEAAFSLDISRDGSYFNPIEAMANICGSSRNAFFRYEGMRGNFKKMNGILSDLSWKLQRVKEALATYQVRAK